ncbi:MAG TPA: ABC transporter ATP-binding protein [Symbiobacteriaceae bacterium]|nr:ABC transporter ATP-binding protein [Symbiobacteriaceae bacterium]
MQTFTYARKGAALRSQVSMLVTMLSADVVMLLVFALIVPGWWKAVVGGGGAAMVALAVRLLTAPLRTAHTLDDRELRLRVGRFRAAIDRERIGGVALHAGPVPRGVAVPTRPVVYHPDTDTLYVLADKRGLVEVTLTQPGRTKTRRLGEVQFSRLVLSLDEPASFVAALGAVAPAVAEVTAPLTAPTVSASGDAVISLDGLVRQFGDFTAVGGISLAVKPGEILAFLGSNGAGKTTTIRMITGLLRPTGGRVLVDGQDLWTGGPEVRRQIGYVPDVPMLYEGLTAREFLWLVAGLYGLTPSEGRTRAAELLALLKLERWGDHLIRHFSLGMKRKMAIAAALVHRPRVLLLDEVTNGLDPRAAREIKDLIAAAARDGAAVFLTTHLLDVAQELAHRVAVIDRGHLRAVGTLDDLRRLAGRPGAGLEELFLALTETGVSA